MCKFRKAQKKYKGIIFPLFWSAHFTAFSNPPQQGTVLLTTVTFYVVVPNDLREFVPAISFVKLGIVERGHLVPDKPVVKIAISISLLLLSLLLSMITGFIELTLICSKSKLSKIRWKFIFIKRKSSQKTPKPLLKKYSTLILKWLFCLL